VLTPLVLTDTELDEALEVWEEALDYALAPLIAHGDAATT
jgi:hypothetical protein